MNMRKSIVFFVLPLVIVLFGSAYAQMQGMGGHETGHMMRHGGEHGTCQCKKDPGARDEGGCKHHQEMHGKMQKKCECMMGGMVKGPMMGSGMMMGKIDQVGRMEKHFSVCMQNAEKLGLSEEQLKNLGELHREQMKKIIRIRSEIQVLQVDLKGELEKPVPDLARVETLLEKQGPLSGNLFLETVRTRVGASNIMSEEQHRKLRELMKGMSGEICRCKKPW